MRWQWWEWGSLLGTGVLCVGLFVYLLIWKLDHKLDTSLLGLLTLGVVCMGLSVFQPDSFKYGDLELKRLKQDADDAVKAALEAAAMNIWNAGRWGSIDEENQSKVVDGILEKLYGDDAQQYKWYLQKKGMYLTSEADLKAIPDDVKLPKGIRSPLLDDYFKGGWPKRPLDGSK
ncbi:MAG: hypothetical protein AB7T49_00245 [Oligoflexales bacterium]